MVFKIMKKLFARFKRDYSLPYSQQPYAFIYRGQINLPHNFLKYILILSTHLRLGLLGAVFHSVFSD
jgi:hypothetical protein